MIKLQTLMRFLPDPLPAKKQQQQQKIIEQPLTEDVESRPLNELGIHLSEHVGVIGKTGSGKTYFAVKGLLEYMRQLYPNAKRYILDSSDDPQMEQLVFNPLVVYGNKMPDRLRDAQQTLIWKPSASKLPRTYARWFSMLNDAREEQIIVVDEASSITGAALDEMEGMLKQMRKHGGSVIVCGQGIAGVDTDLFRQLTHYFQFRLNPETYDTWQARNYLDIAKSDQRPPRHKYGFFYRRTDGDYPTKEFRDMTEFFDGRNLLQWDK